ncbi:MAG TPA: hypothetical protein VJM80_00780 [bacterium]|nr:hypothetical protein [bacterium]
MSANAELLKTIFQELLNFDPHPDDLETLSQMIDTLKQDTARLEEVDTTGVNPAFLSEPFAGPRKV